MENKKNFGFGTQIRKSPYFNSTVKWGATDFSVYNHWSYLTSLEFLTHIGHTQ